MATFTDIEVANFLAARQADLLAPENRKAFAFSNHFRAALPEGGGVYVLFFSDDLFYVGETTSLRQRLGTHMRNPENHVLALKIARQLYDRAHGVGKAGKTKKFEEAHKELTRDWISSNLTVAFVELRIGRKELEERVFGAFNPPFNNRDPQLP